MLKNVVRGNQRLCRPRQPAVLIITTHLLQPMLQEFQSEKKKTLIITNVKYFYNGNQTNKGQQFNELSLEKASNMLDTRLII